MGHGVTAGREEVWPTVYDTEHVLTTRRRQLNQRQVLITHAVDCEWAYWLMTYLHLILYDKISKTFNDSIQNMYTMLCNRNEQTCILTELP